MLVFSLLGALPAMAQDEPAEEGMEASDPSSQLVEAVHSAEIRDVRTLLGEGADPNAISEAGTPVLCHAAMKGNADIVAALVEAGADLEAKDRSGATALMYAAQFGHNDILASLLEAGASVSATDNLNWTPLTRAVIGGNAEGVTALLEAGADPSVQDFFGRDARQVAEGRDNEEVKAALSGQGSSESSGS